MQVELANVSKSYGDTQAVDNITMSIRPGEFFTLLGPSGCGKSTTLRMIAGLESLDSGSIRLAGQEVARPGFSLPIERRKVGLVFQDSALFPHLTVLANTGFGLPKARDRAARIEELLELVSMSAERDRFPRELSGGQQQRVALARALAPKPDVMLLDEPFSSLDPALRGRLRTDVRSILERAGTTVVLVTHDQEEALSMSDRIAVLIDGQVHQIGTPGQLYESPATSQVATFIGDALLLDGIAQSGNVMTTLGHLACTPDVSGEVKVVLRPEMVALEQVPPQQGTDRLYATVVDRRFFGHDHLVKVRMRHGLVLESRVHGQVVPEIGSTVRCQIRQPVPVIPQEP